MISTDPLTIGEMVWAYLFIFIETNLQMISMGSLIFIEMRSSDLWIFTEIPSNDLLTCLY